MSKFTFGSLGTATVVLLVLATKAQAADDFFLQLDLHGSKSSISSGVSEDNFGIDLTGYFDLGAPVKPSYSILAEQPFLQRKSSVTLSYEETDRDIKNASRSPSNIRNTFTQLPVARPGSDDITGADVTAMLDIDSIITDLGIVTLTPAEVELQLEDLIDDALASPDIASVAINEGDQDFEKLSISTHLVVGQWMVVELGYSSTDSSLLRTRTGTIFPSIIAQIGTDASVAGEVLTFDGPFDQVIATGQSIFVEALEQFGDFDRKQLDFGLGAYVSESSTIMLHYSVSETDLELAAYEADFEKIAVEGKFVGNIPDSELIYVTELGASRSNLSHSNAYRGLVDFDFDLYFGDRFSIGGGVAINTGSDVDEFESYKVNAGYFITENLSVSAQFSLDNFSADSDSTEEIDVNNRENFAITLSGRL